MHAYSIQIRFKQSDTKTPINILNTGFTKVFFKVFSFLNEIKKENEFNDNILNQREKIPEFVKTEVKYTLNSI